MLTMSKMPGNLGNRLFQVASMIGLADTYKHGLSLPAWEYSDVFEGVFHTIPIRGVVVPEMHFHYQPEYFAGLENNELNFDVKGWMQSEKYWEHCKGKVLEAFKFRGGIDEKYRHLFSKPTLAISIRRGDYVDNENYELLPASYYYLAMIEHFPDWRERNILIFSDDPAYCRVHFECIGAHIIEDTPVNQLRLGSMCDDFIIANSTFSWWMAYLAQKGKVIRPAYLFAGPLLAKSDSKDFYPEEWVMFDHKDRKLSMTDHTFMIPVQYDHPDRKQNLDLCVCMLQKDIECKIIVGENQTNAFGYMEQWCKYITYDYPHFHRTRMLNEMATVADTPFIVNYDCDNFIPPLQLYMMTLRLRAGDDMVYPFDGQSARMPREIWFKPFEKYLDCGIVQDTKFMGKNGGKPRLSSVGHAIGFNKQSFFEGGGENENFISFGPEDVERYERFNLLGYKVSRIEGACYHMDHYCGPDSSRRNPFFGPNHDELKRLRAMTKEGMLAEVHSWKWYKPYTASYYESITEDAIKSRDEVFRILGIGKDADVVDLGCGVGQWGVGLPNYTGVDFNVPRDKVIVPNYQEWDLRKPFNNIGENVPGSVIICLEVAEHIEEKYADILVDNICSLEEDGMIIFSAAIPYQGGTGHVNEQWQTYWAAKFKERGYTCYFDEYIRANKDICLWYRQNIFIAVRDTYKDSNITDFVLPEYYLQSMKNALIK